MLAKNNKALVDKAKDFDIVMPMYILFKYSNNYFMISGSLWNYYRYEVNDAANEIVADYTISKDK